jgi:outer membrane protein
MNERTYTPLTAVILCLATGAAAQSPPPPLTLRQAAELALVHAPELAAAQAAAAESAAAARLAADEFHPEAWLTGAPGWARGVPLAIAGSVPAALSVACRTTLYDRSSRLEVLQRQAAASEAAGRGERARLDILREALVAYARCWADDAIVAAGKERQQAAARIAGRAQQRQAEGRGTELDVDEARLTLARARMRALDLETERELDRLDLARLTGVPAEELSFPARDPLEGLPDVSGGDGGEAAQAADAELHAADRSIRLLEQAAGLATTSFTPVVQAEAQYARLSRMNDFDTYYRRFAINDWSVGVVVALPLWSGGRESDVAARTAATLARVQDQRRSRASALAIGVRRSDAEAERAGAAAQIGRQAVAVAEDGLRVVRALAAEGRADADEVDRRVLTLADAREEAARARLSCFAARVERLALHGDLLTAVTGPAGPAPSARANALAPR